MAAALLILVLGACSSSSHQASPGPDRAAWHRWTIAYDFPAGPNGIAAHNLNGADFDTYRPGCRTPAAVRAHYWALLSHAPPLSIPGEPTISGDVDLAPQDLVLAQWDFICGTGYALDVIHAIPNLSHAQRVAALSEVQRLDHSYRSN
jgi:hypothetical protein